VVDVIADDGEQVNEALDDRLQGLALGRHVRGQMFQALALEGSVVGHHRLRPLAV